MATKLKTTSVLVAVLLVLVVLSMAAEAQRAGRGKGAAASAPATGAARRHQMHRIHLKNLGQAERAVDKAIAALQQDDKDKAMAELRKAKKLLAETRTSMAHRGKGQVVNARCPMMGTALDPEKVSKNLTRTFKGRTVGFCCHGCPAAWDKLSDDDKADKLRAAMPKHPRKGKPEKGHSDMH